ncbi:hypothetical protein [Citrobacter sp. Cpo015]|uniref:hypothetical protein n=1 Tax=Citrobacter sp. Cpo015 TaxID=2985121 RepID=UPI0025757B99|nr:hypothetical protein [Citrobacter sp. Cpo015]MDM2906874.1 hypothetical protein [Citrobacter sp. Cpo015]
MKQESDHSPLLWSVVIAIFGLAAIAFFIIAGNAKKQEISFSCSSEFTSILDIQNTKKELHGIMLITSYNSGHLSLSVQGKLKSDDGEFAVNRKLFFRYARPLGHTAGVFMLTPDGREKSPDDDATDAVDYLFFDAYERANKLYMLKHLNEETVLIGDNFSPRFACVMNHFAS